MLTAALLSVAMKPGLLNKRTSLHAYNAHTFYYVCIQLLRYGTLLYCYRPLQVGQTPHSPIRPGLLGGSEQDSLTCRATEGLNPRGGSF